MHAVGKKCSNKIGIKINKIIAYTKQRVNNLEPMVNSVIFLISCESQDSYTANIQLNKTLLTMCNMKVCMHSHVCAWMLVLHYYSPPP